MAETVNVAEDAETAIALRIQTSMYDLCRVVHRYTIYQSMKKKNKENTN